MLTGRTTLQPNGQVQLPLALAKGRPVPAPATGQPGGDAPAAASVGSIAKLRALLASPALFALPEADPAAADARSQARRNDWNDA